MNNIRGQLIRKNFNDLSKLDIDLDNERHVKELISFFSEISNKKLSDLIRTWPNEFKNNKKLALKMIKKFSLDQLHIRLDEQILFDKELLKEVDFYSNFFAKNMESLYFYSSEDVYKEEYVLSLYKKLNELNKLDKAGWLFNKSKMEESINAKKMLDNIDFIIKLFDINEKVFYILEEEFFMKTEFIKIKKNKLWEIFNQDAYIKERKSDLFELVSAEIRLSNLEGLLVKENVGEKLEKKKMKI